MQYPVYRSDVPYLTTAQMVEVDRAMIEDYGISLIQMMENAGRNLAHLARHRFLDGNPQGKRVIILAGTGGNGGGGLVCARRLHNYGAKVRVFVTAEDERFTPVPAHQLAIIRQMGIPVNQDIAEVESPDLIIDAIIGYSLRGAPRGTAKDFIEWANQAKSDVLSLDTPSGIDTSTGTVYEPTIRATATLTLALPKAGLGAEGVSAHVGELYLADISVPPELYAREPLNLDTGSIFAQSDIIRLK